MANASIITEYFKTTLLKQIINDLSNTYYYIMVGNHEPLANVSILPTAPNNDIRDLVQDVHFKGIFGKIITQDNALLMIKNIPYVVNTVYSMYDDNDLDLFMSDYFVNVNEGTYTHVYKCLDNNMGNPSTIQPAFTDVSNTDTLFKLSDGYRWKYMYSVDATTVADFGSTSYLPLYPNTDIIDMAEPGTIDVMAIDQGGLGYTNYYLGAFTTTDIRVNGNSMLYNLSATSNSIPNSTNNFYEGCILYISSGTGIGQFKNVVSYFVTNTGNYIVTDSAFTITPGVNDTYEIYPSVRVLGGGTETINALGRAIINSVGNSVQTVEMLNTGLGYRYAVANVYNNPIVSVTQTASVRPIYPPPGGHGFDPASELRALNLGFSIQFRQSESNTIPVTNIYRQLSIIRDPIFANTIFTLANTSGTFQVAEPVYKINPQEVAANVTIGSVNLTSNIITTSSGNFATDFHVGDFIYVSNGSVSQLSTVATVINTSAVSMSQIGAFACSSAVVYFPQARLIGTVATLATNTITLAGVHPYANVNDMMVGNFSGATGTISNISRSGISKNFDTFVANWQYNITYSFGTFNVGETVYQGDSLANATATALVHSISNNVLLVTEQIGRVNASANLVGANSGAIAAINTKYYPEIRYGTAEVLYVENIIPITRNNQTDVIRLNINLGI